MARRGGTRAQREGVKQRRKAGQHFDLKISGKKQVIKNLNMLKLNIARKVVNAANEQAAKRILAPAVKAALATVSPGRFTSRPNRRRAGALKSNPVTVYKVSRKKTSMYWQVAAPSRRALDLKPKEFYYPLFLEKGGRASGFFGPHYIEGQHMLKRTRTQKAPRMKKFLRRTIRLFMNDEIKRIAGANARKIARGGKPQRLTRSAQQIASFRKRGII